MDIFDLWRMGAAPFVKMWHRVLPLRFLIVGGWNFGFSYLFFAAIYWLLHDKVHDSIILGISSVVGITNAFICHRLFTYRSKGHVVLEYFRFYLVYGVQLGINFIAFLFLVQRFHTNAYLTQAVLSILLTLMSYWGHKHVSFNYGKVGR